jgi:LysR family transcriptional regulator, glycine cleavage system transcriptional activator
VDVGLILARNKLPGHYYRPLFKSYLKPVASPSLKITSLDELKKHKLIDVYTAEEDWQIWLEGVGAKGVKPANRLAVDSYILAQESAIEGRGLAMTIGPYAAEEIKLGRLVEPFAQKIEHRHHWYFACSSEHKNKNKVKRFEEWLVKQVAADPMLEVLKPRWCAGQSGCWWRCFNSAAFSPQGEAPISTHKYYFGR